MHKKGDLNENQRALTSRSMAKGNFNYCVKENNCSSGFKVSGVLRPSEYEDFICNNKMRLWQFLAHFPKVSISISFTVGLCIPLPLPLLGNGIFSSTKGRIGLWVQLLWLSTATDLLLLLPLRRRLKIQSQSYVTTDGQSASQCSCQAPSGAQDQIVTVRQLRVYWCRRLL
jgi:hypothetical protein